jgi:hypothetical protein
MILFLLIILNLFIYYFYRQEGFTRASYAPDLISQWFEQLPGRGYPKPQTSALEFLVLVNK